MKTLLAIALGLGFLVLDSKAAPSKPTLAFLGVTEDSDPQIRQNLTQRIRFELSGDSSIFVFPKGDIDLLFAKGIIQNPEITALDLPGLSKGLAAQYYAFARLEPLGNSSKRIWWKPWSLKVKWNQDLHLRILESATGIPVFDSTVSGQLDEKGFMQGPENWQLMSPRERDGYLQRMLPVLSQASAKVLAKAIQEKTAPVEAAVSK